MIYCVWYPSGGFGHFINAVLTLHGENFVRPNNKLEFSKTGDSHNLDLVVPKYFHNHWPGGIEFIDTKNYSVLIDNGINNESDNFKYTFPDSTVVKICYTDHSWPVIARTVIEKAMHSTIEHQLPLDNWHTDESWASREKYFLYLRDHNLRHAWRATDTYAIEIDQLYNNYDQFFNSINSIVKIQQCEDLWTDWYKANATYIVPVKTATDILDDIAAKRSSDLTHINDLWTQAVVYYYIWLKFGIEVPHNDYADWFTNTNDIVTMLINHGVEV